MSWDSYIDSIKGPSGTCCDKACIIGLDGVSWTTDSNPSNLQCTAGEGATIAQCFKKKDFAHFAANGVHINGQKYQFLREDNNVVLAKKKGMGAITIQSSKTALVIGHTKEGGQQANTNKGVSSIAEYLEGLNM